MGGNPHPIAATEGKKMLSMPTRAANLEPDLPSDSYVARALKRSLKAQEVSSQSNMV
jgi:hypothetical protein